MAADEQDHLWSARMLAEDPAAVQQVHTAFYEAGMPRFSWRTSMFVFIAAIFLPALQDDTGSPHTFLDIHSCLCVQVLMWPQQPLTRHPSAGLSRQAMAGQTQRS